MMGRDAPNPKDFTEASSNEEATAHSSAMFSGDQPIKSSSEDVLNRHDFATAIARAIAAWKGDSSLILALYGEWGSGKTSIKNMILERLRKAEPDLTCMDFNPWAWSGQDAIFSAFLKEVGIALASKSKDEAGKATKSNWNKYASRLMLGSTALKYLKTGSQLAGLPGLPFVFELAEQATSHSSEILKQANEAESADDDETLESLKLSLANSLLALDKPLLIVLDDVDRLSSEEIKLLFRLLKANLDFPKTIFLLLFDRSVVEKALSDASGQDGRAYMEKIIQAGFDLPAIARTEILDSLASGLEKIFGSVSSPPTDFDQDRWAIIFHLGIAPFFKTMRDIIRFNSALSFMVGMFDKDGALEVNPVDLAALEVLRLFEPTLYKSLYSNKYVLVKGSSSTYGNYGEQEKARKEQFEALVKLASISNQPAARKILQELFPTVHQNFSGFDGIWLRSLRICSAQIFDRYFLLSVPQGDVPHSIIEEIRRALPNSSELLGLLQRFSLEGKLEKVLERLCAYAETFGISSAENLITAIWDVGDSLKPEPYQIFSFGPALTGFRIVLQIMGEEKSAAVRSSILLTALQKTTGLSFPFKLVHLETEQETTPGKSDYLFDLPSLSEAKKIIVDKFRALALAKKLIGDDLGLYLAAWAAWGSADEAKDYAQKLLVSVEGSLHLLQGFVYDQRPTNLNSGVTRSNHVLKLDEIAKYVNVNLLEKTLKPLVDGEVTEENAHLISQFGTELATFKAAIAVKEAEDLKDEESVEAQ